VNKVSPIVISIVLVALCLCGTAQAGHINLPVKWSQAPDMGVTAYDQRAEHPVQSGGQVLADDFQCLDPNPVVAVRWWGSYLNPAYEPTATRYLPFELAFHTGDSAPPPHSQPGPWTSFYHVQAQEDYFGTDATGQKVYEYNAYLPTPFVQQLNGIYWLDCELQLDTINWPFYTWGWHNTNQPWGDHAAYSTVGHNGPWNEDCEGQAFELMVIPEPSALVALSSGLAGLLGLAARKRR
jgi:hypothetical protein